MLNERTTEAGLPCRGLLRRHPGDLRWVQPPDAENRTSGGVEGLRGAIPVAPSDQFQDGASDLEGANPLAPPNFLDEKTAR